jgi:hypothetical protein
MSDIPRIVRQRLAATARPGVHAEAVHPDADLLTAFAEQSLLEQERNSLLAHLADCAECREVVVVASPEIAAAAQEIPARSGWLGWPALRWGALAACAVIVVAAVSLRPRSPETARIVIPEDSAQLAAKTEEAKTDANPQPPAALRKDRVAMDYKSRDEIAQTQERAFRVPKHLATRASVSSSAVSQAGVSQAGVSQAGVSQAKMTPATTVPAVRSDKPALSSGALAAAVAENKPAGNIISAPSAAAPAPAREEVTADAAVASVQTEPAQPTLGKAKQVFQGLGQAMSTKREAMPAVPQFPGRKITPRWTLAADGTLERSLDSGKTWKTIPVAADATLTAVAAMDSDIWVGGSHGALYHSSDAGEHWTQVIPASHGQPLTSNVIGIAFTDAIHGRITTSNQEIWITSDGGQSWQISQ